MNSSMTLKQGLIGNLFIEKNLKLKNENYCLISAGMDNILSNYSYYTAFITMIMFKDILKIQILSSSYLTSYILFTTLQWMELYHPKGAV